MSPYPAHSTSPAPTARLIDFDDMLSSPVNGPDSRELSPKDLPADVLEKRSTPVLPGPSNTAVGNGYRASPAAWAGFSPWAWLRRKTDETYVAGQARDQAGVLLKMARQAQTSNDSQKALALYQSVESAAKKYGFSFDALAFEEGVDAEILATKHRNSSELRAYLISKKLTYNMTEMRALMAQVDVYAANTDPDYRPKWSIKELRYKIKKKADANHTLATSWVHLEQIAVKRCLLSGDDQGAYATTTNLRSRLLEYNALHTGYIDSMIQNVDFAADLPGKLAFDVAEKFGCKAMLAYLLAEDESTAKAWLDGKTAPMPDAPDAPDAVALQAIDYAAKHNFSHEMGTLWRYGDSPTMTHEILGTFFLHRLADTVTSAPYILCLQGMACAKHPFGGKFIQLVLHDETAALLPSVVKAWIADA